jgi:PII-like signaling protein
MATETVTVARIYLREGEHLLAEIIRFLRDQEKVAGLTVLRGIVGFGSDGQLHTSSLTDLSLDLPLIIEFYDLPARIETILQQLKVQIPVSHILSWQAESHCPPLTANY